MKMIIVWLAIVATAIGTTSCGGDSSGGSDLLVGGWAGGGLYACFSADGRAAFGDRQREVGDACCTWKADGTFTFADGGTGRWRLSGEALKLEMDPPCSEECAATYQRDGSLACFDGP